MNNPEKHLFPLSSITHVCSCSHPSFVAEAIQQKDKKELLAAKSKGIETPV